MKSDAIIGAICGDVIGSAYEFTGVNEGNIEFFTKGCRYTDDTVLTIAVTDWINHPEKTVQDCLLYYGRLHFFAGYGPSFCRWLGENNPQPYNSCGNGSAMRVSAVGCKANSIEEAMNLAEESAIPTHNHPEGIKGAQATAVAIFLARQGNDKQQIKQTLQEMFDYDLNRSYKQLFESEYKFNVICQTTVPEALICFFESDSYEDCIKKAMLTNKDTDTAAAVAGAVAGAYYGIPEGFREKVFSILPDHFKKVIEDFEKI